MLTPEIQQYINQQRSAGVSDSQIRQALAQQGWQVADLNQAFGVVPADPAVPVAPIATSGKTPAWVKWLIGIVIFLFVLPGLIWLGILGFGYYAVTHSGVSYTNSGASPTSNPKKPLNCDAPELSSTGLGKLSPTLPATWPSDIPVYPESKLLGATSLGVGTAVAFSQVAYCSKDSVDKIVDYFKNSRSGWIFTQSFSESQSSNTVNGKSISLTGKKSGPGGVTVGISNTGNGADTLILEIYGGSASSQSAGPIAPGMKIYNASPNFSVQIPIDWETAESISLGEAYLISPPEKDFLANILIAQSKVSYSFSPSSVAQSEKENQQKDYPQYKVISEDSAFFMDGLISYKRVYSWHDSKKNLDLTAIQIFTNKQGNLFTITATSLTSLYSKYGPIFQSAIDSFKTP